MAQWEYEWHHGDIHRCTETIKRFVDRNNVDSWPVFSVVTALPGESIFFPWTNGVDVEVFQRIFSPKVEFLHRPLILPFISWALFDCPKGVARRLKAGLVVTLKRTKARKRSGTEERKKEKEINPKHPIIFRIEDCRAPKRTEYKHQLLREISAIVNAETGR